MKLLFHKFICNFELGNKHVDMLQHAYMSTIFQALYRTLICNAYTGLYRTLFIYTFHT